MAISTRTPEGLPSRCSLCGADARLEYSSPLDDATCPQCGALLLSSDAVIDHLSQRMQNQLAAQLGVESNMIVPKQSMAKQMGTLGSDSLDKVEMIINWEEEFDINIPDDIAEQLESIEDVARYIAKQLRSAPGP